MSLGQPPGGQSNGFKPPSGYGSPAPGIQPPDHHSGTRTDTLALMSLVLGILSLPGHFCCYLGWFFGIGSIILGILSYNKINKEPHLWGGKGIALAGIITSVAGFVLIVLFFMIYGVAVFMTP